MSDITQPNPTILKIVEQQYRNDNEVSREQQTQIALLMTRGLADPKIRKNVEDIQASNKARNDLKAKYEKDGTIVDAEFAGGDLGELTSITLQGRDKSVKFTEGAEFEAFRKIYDKRASQVKGLHMEVLKVAAKDDLSAKVALRVGRMLYSMACSGEINGKLLESIKVQEPQMQMNSGVDEQMQRALAAFEKSAGELPVGGSPESLAVARTRKGHGGFDLA
jgi:hypothetical protein